MMELFELCLMVAFALLALGALGGFYYQYQKNKRSIEAELDKLRKFNLKPESVKPDSEFFEAQCPDCQFAVFLEFDNSKKIVGHGFRMEDSLIMPAHVLGAFPEDLWITKGRRVKSGWVHDTMIKASDFVWKPLIADVVYAEIGNKNIPGLKKAAVAPYWGDPMVSIATYYDTNNCSIGKMTPSSFGMLEYHGSTRGGFSGAVYLLENKVAAMHLGGGVANLAVAASYLKSLMYVPESSEIAALKHSLKRARKQEVQWSTTGDPDTVQVNVRGRYFRVDRNEFDEIYDEAQDAWDEFQEEYERKQSRKKRGRDTHAEARDEKYHQSVSYDYDEESARPKVSREMVPQEMQYVPESALSMLLGRSQQPKKKMVDAGTQSDFTTILNVKKMDLPPQWKVSSYRVTMHKLHRVVEYCDPSSSSSYDSEEESDTPPPQRTVLAGYIPESQENSERPTRIQQGGSVKDAKTPTLSLSPVVPRVAFKEPLPTKETLSGLNVTREPSTKASASTTSTVSGASQTSKPPRRTKRRSSRRSSPKSAQ